MALEGLNIGIDLLETIFIKTTGIGGNFWLIQMTIILATMILLTRKISDWKTLAFPVIVGWHTFGLRMPWIFMVGAGTMFVIDNLSMQVMGNVIGRAKGFISERSFDTPKKKLIRRKFDRELKKTAFAKKRIDIKDEIEKLKIQGGEDYRYAIKEKKTRENILQRKRQEQELRKFREKEEERAQEGVEKILLPPEEARSRKIQRQMEKRSVYTIPRDPMIQERNTMIDNQIWNQKAGEIGLSILAEKKKKKIRKRYQQ